MRILFLSVILIIINFNNIFAQINNKTNEELDSIYISEIENVKGPLKILHAEPLYIDLIRDLGAKAGEKEWNMGFGLTDNNKSSKYNALIEYEFAPIDRLGFEIEIPLTLNYGLQNGSSEEVEDKIESIKLATQWTFHVNDDLNASFAIGYINEFEFSNFRNMKNKLFSGNIFNPFLVGAKRWGDNFHTLIYTGPKINYEFENKQFHTSYEMHTSIHYLISGTRNFIGLETSKYLSHNSNFDLVFRPQMRVGLADNLLVGLVNNIPINKDNERFGFFVRLIWEPGHNEF